MDIAVNKAPVHRRLIGVRLAFRFASRSALRPGCWPPHGKDIEEGTLVDLRRMLRQAGFGQEGDAASLISARATMATGSGASPRRPV